MSAKDAEVTEEDRRAVAERHAPLGFADDSQFARWVRQDMNVWHPDAGLWEDEAQFLANARRDAYRAGQIAGLEECMTIFTDHCKDDFADSGELDRICAVAEARIAELEEELG